MGSSRCVMGDADVGWCVMGDADVGWCDTARRG